tara:strand:- start:140340 stop:140618 length:279 start_codon:yes stop_codon:yes gene_type:complete
MQSRGKACATLHQTQAYLIALVKQLSQAFKATNVSQGIEVPGGYRDTFETAIYSSMDNVLKRTFLDLQFSMQRSGKKLTVECHASRIYIIIR